MAFLMLWFSVFFAGSAVSGSPLQRYVFEHPQMGTRFRISCYAPGEDRAAAAAAAAFARIDSLNAVFSDYDPDSELSRLARQAGDGRFHPVSDDLWAVLRQGQRLARLSDGAFDLSVGPLSRLWRWSFRRQEWPPADRLQAAKQAVGYQHLRLADGRQAVRLELPGMRLDAGGIAKGYAVDAALDVLHLHGIERALVDGGGDLRAGAPPPGTKGWTVQLPTGGGPDSTILLQHEAVATSGATYRYLSWQGKRYSHIIDPRTGLGVDHGALVSVRAPTCTLADALASTLTVLDPARYRDFMRHFPEAAARILRPGDPPAVQYIHAFSQP